jgi:hypothetical protein
MNSKKSLLWTSADAYRHASGASTLRWSARSPQSRTCSALGAAEFPCASPTVRREQGLPLELREEDREKLREGTCFAIWPSLGSLAATPPGRRARPVVI